MENYMDQSFVVTCNTIVAYTGSRRHLDIPEKFADIEINKIGGGSFMESRFLESIEIPKSIKTIGKSAFENCWELRHVILHGGDVQIESHAFGGCNAIENFTVIDLEITPSEYNKLINSSRKTPEGILVSTVMPDVKIIRDLDSESMYKFAKAFPEDIPMLFFGREVPESEKGLINGDEVEILGFLLSSEPISETDGLLGHTIANPPIVDQKSEEANDRAIRRGTPLPCAKTKIFTFDDRKTKKIGRKYYITAEMKVGFFFWQSYRKVVLNNETYAVYIRNYLSSDSKSGYVRRDVAVYGSGGLITDREEAGRVYEKYRILSIL